MSDQSLSFPRGEPAGPALPADGSPEPPEPNSITVMRRILAEGQHQRIGGVLVEVPTARAVVALFDELSPRLRAKFAAMPVALMARTASALLSQS